MSICVCRNYHSERVTININNLVAVLPIQQCYAIDTAKIPTEEVNNAVLAR